MKYLSTILLIFTAFAAQLTAQTKIDLVLLRNNQRIESISFFNLDQKVYIENIPYADSIHLEFASGGDDIFNISYKGEGATFKKQIWVGANTTKIYVTINEKTLSIESVLGDDIYEQSIRFYQEIKAYKNASETEMSAFLLEKINTHINSPFSLSFSDIFVKKLIDNKEELAKLIKIMESQPEIVKKHTLFDGVYLRALAILKIDALDFQLFSVINPQSEEVHISKQNEPNTVIDFWFVGCPPCVKDHQEMKKDIEAGIWNEKARFIGVSTDDDLDIWKKYLIKHEIKWDNYIENNNQEDRLSNQLMIRSFPTYCLLDKSNVILKYFGSYKELKKYLSGE